MIKSNRNNLPGLYLKSWIAHQLNEAQRETVHVFKILDKQKLWIGLDKIAII